MLEDFLKTIPKNVTRKLVEADIHCSATRVNWMANNTFEEQCEEIRHWHTDPKPEGRGWSDWGYHFIIGRKPGEIMMARPLRRTGAHILGRNSDTIGICLLGGHGSNEHDEFKENFTEWQDEAVRALIQYLRKIYPTIKRIAGHNEFAAKACPGFQVMDWWKNPPFDVKPDVVVGQISPKEPELEELPLSEIGKLLKLNLLKIMEGGLDGYDSAILLATRSGDEFEVYVSRTEGRLSDLIVGAEIIKTETVRDMID